MRGRCSLQRFSLFGTRRECNSNIFENDLREIASFTSALAAMHLSPP